MVTRKESGLVEISELIKRPLSGLKGRQLDVVKAHRAAARAWNKFSETGQKRTIGIYQRGLPEHSKEEFGANSLALTALRKSIEYYHSYGKLERAYSEVREVARQHWHPVVHEMWYHHFQNRANDAKIEISGNLAQRIARDQQSDVNETLRAVDLSNNPRGKPN